MTPTSTLAAFGDEVPMDINGEHVYRVGAVEVRTPVSIPETEAQARSGFRCGVLRCRMGNGTQCGNRWAAAQGGAIELEKCRVCPAGAARAAILDIKPQTEDGHAAERKQVRFMGQSASKKHISAHTARAREQVMEKRKRVDAAKAARIEAMMERVIDALKAGPAQSAAEIGRRLFGDAVPPMEYTAVCGAVKALEAKAVIVRGSKGLTLARGFRNPEAATQSAEPAEEPSTLPWAPDADKDAKIAHLEAERTGLINRLDEAERRIVRDGDNHRADMKRVEEERDRYYKEMRHFLSQATDLETRCRAIEGERDRAVAEKERGEAKVHKELALVYEERDNYAALLGTHAIALQDVCAAIGYTGSQWDDLAAVVQGVRDHLATEASKWVREDAAKGVERDALKRALADAEREADEVRAALIQANRRIDFLEKWRAFSADAHPLIAALMERMVKAMSMEAAGGACHPHAVVCAALDAAQSFAEEDGSEHTDRIRDVMRVSKAEMDDLKTTAALAERYKQRAHRQAAVARELAEAIGDKAARKALKRAERSARE